MKKAMEEPNIVETYKFGNSTVHIASNFFVSTPEAKQRVLNEMHAIGWLIEEKRARQEVASSRECRL
ncbi:hypothetical protein ACFFK0_16615 [Paenibacillus chartarius]|uniref:Uncharacterized protein n=1 Tax=Paenibacillus chartarius TaxID=747481 RepID=A0ABV6DN77_9BACL